MARAIWNGQVIAESDETVVVEGNHYFPRRSLKEEYLEPSEHRSSCPWKGKANYFSLRVAGKTNIDAAWYYPEPMAKAGHIRDRIAFWKGVVVED